MIFYKDKLKQLTTHIFLITTIFIILLPIIYMISTAFRQNQSILSPLFDVNTWVDDTNAIKSSNKISKNKLNKLIIEEIYDVINHSNDKILIPKELVKNLKSWINSNGKKQNEFFNDFNNLINASPEIYREPLKNILYQENGDLRYKYDIRISLENFKFFFTGKESERPGYIYPVKQWFFNSMKISVTVTFLQVLIVILAAFAISRFKFYGKSTVIFLIVVLQVFPASMMMIAFYLILDYIGNIVPQIGLDTIPGLILIYLGAGVPLNIWLSKSYFNTLPDSLEESAMIDGANYHQIFFYIIVPLITPIIAVIGILSFIATYNEFLLATFLITKPVNLTLPVGLSFFMDGEVVRFGTFSAIAVIGSIPVLIIWLFFQKYIIAGLTHSSVKE